MSTLTNITLPKVELKKYLVVKFIGILGDQGGLKCIPSRWVNSYRDDNVLTRYPPSYDEQRTMQLIILNFPALSYWKTFLAVLFYQSDDFGDVMRYVSHCASSRREAAASTSTNIQNSFIDDPSFGELNATKGLTLAEQLIIIRPLVASILRFIDLFSDKYGAQLQSLDKNCHYKLLKAQAVSYARLLLIKVMRFVNLYCTDGRNFDTAAKAISKEMKKKVLELLLIMEYCSELALLFKMYSRLGYFYMAELLKTYHPEMTTFHSSIQYNSSLTKTGETSDYQIEFSRWVYKKLASDNSQSSMLDKMAEIISVHSDGSENSMDQEDVDIDDDLLLNLSMRSLEPDQSLTPSRMSPDLGQDINNLYWAASGSSTSSSYTNENWTLKYQQHSPGLIELLPHTGVYIRKEELDDCLQSAKKCTQLHGYLVSIKYYTWAEA